MTDKTCIIITGPTAVGKTAIALELARYFNTDIISADSRQCYRELHIGVAKPTREELAQVHHYFIDSHSIGEEVNASVFENYALEAVSRIFAQRNVAIMAGGTGLYIKAFCEGMDDIPVVDPSLRQRITRDYQEKGFAWLQQQVREQDPLFYATGETLNPQRMMRALEVAIGTGNSFTFFHTREKKERPFKIIKIGIQLPREQLYDNINRRVNRMILDGLVDEVRALMPFRACNALQTVGYKELFEYLDGSVTEEAAVAAIQMNTRHYAKRQMTWFKKDETLRWYLPWQQKEIIESILAK